MTKLTGVLVVRRDAYDLLPHQLLDELGRRHLLPAPVPELSVVAVPPRVDLVGRRECHRVGPTARDLGEEDAVQVLDEGRLYLVDLVAVSCQFDGEKRLRLSFRSKGRTREKSKPSQDRHQTTTKEELTELTVLPPAERVHLPVGRDDRAVESPARDLHRSLPQQRLDQPRTMTVPLRTVSQPAELPLAPRVNLPGVREAPRVEPARAQLHDPLPRQPLQQLGGVLVTLRVAVPRHAVLLVTPRVQAAPARDHCGVPAPARDVDHGQSDEAVDTLGRRVSRLVPVSQLAVHPAPPGEEVALGGHGGGVVGTAGDVGYDLAGEGVGEAGDVLPPVVAVAEAAVVATAPGVHLAAF